jgi:hypothetical protein
LDWQIPREITEGTTGIPAKDEGRGKGGGPRRRARDLRRLKCWPEAAL